MGRKSMVTRTINFKELQIMVVDMSTKEVKTASAKYSGDAVKPEKIFAELDFPENIKPVAIISSVEKEQLYGMYEETFLKYATPMESRFEKI